MSWKRPSDAEVGSAWNTSNVTDKICESRSQLQNDEGEGKCEGLGKKRDEVLHFKIVFLAMRLCRAFKEKFRSFPFLLNLHLSNKCDRRVAMRTAMLEDGLYPDAWTFKLRLKIKVLLQKIIWLWALHLLPWMQGRRSTWLDRRISKFFRFFGSSTEIHLPCLVRLVVANLYVKLQRCSFNFGSLYDFLDLEVVSLRFSYCTTLEVHNHSSD